MVPRGCGQKNVGCRAIPAVGFEIVFHSADMVVAQLVAESGQVQALVPVLLAGLVLGAYVREKL